MEKIELDAIKEEMAGLGVRLDNVEGYFSNFDTTLGNHMTDYSQKQAALIGEIAHLREMFNLAFWVVFSINVAFVGGLIALAIMLVQETMKGVAR